MNIVYIYWPPAVWKLTTAKELSKITWYKIFHNHLSHDLVSSILNYEDNKEIFFPLIKDMNLFFLSKIPNNIKWLILTNCYEENKDENYIKSLKKILKTNWWDIKYVRLICDKNNLLDRVENLDRKKTTKLKDRNKLEILLKENNYVNNIKNSNTLVIDNSNISPEEVAFNIKTYYNI